jgi:hypothetical protein
VADAVAAFVTYQPEEHRPDPERHQAYGEAYRRYRDVHYALKPVFGQQAVGKPSRAACQRATTRLGSKGARLSGGPEAALRLPSAILVLMAATIARTSASEPARAAAARAASASLPRAIVGGR